MSAYDIVRNALSEMYETTDLVTVKDRSFKAIAALDRIEAPDPAVQELIAAARACLERRHTTDHERLRIALKPFEEER